jgi:hypothetical protein
MDLVFIALALGLMVAILAGYAAVVSWAVNDARDRGLGGGGVLFLFWLLGPVAVPAWFVLRPNRKLIDMPPHEFPSGEDAIAAASMLDSGGDWDAALAIYRTTALRWPEYAEYIDKCEAEIEKRRALSNGRR